MNFFQLFKEMYQAYTAGRMAVDTSTFWYQGEINFYDNYVIPLAKKSKECNVFGVSSDEYLNYAGTARTNPYLLWNESQLILCKNSFLLIAYL